MDVISFILSLALEKGSDSPSASSVTYDPSTSVGLISTDVQSAIDELSTRGGLKNEIVQVLPQIGEEGICYFVPNNSSEIENIYDEYIWFDSLNDYEKIGSTKVDISDLLKSEAVTEPYDDTKTYEVGDYVTYLGYLYKCKTAVTTAQSFAPAKWDKIDVFTYIKNDGADYIANEKTYNALSTNNKTLTGAINEITGIVGSDNAPYVYRQTPFIASQENLKSIVGGSVVWNQKVNSLNESAEVYGITRAKVSTDINDGLRVYGTSTASTYFPSAQIDNFNAAHKYFVSLGNVTLPNGSKLYLPSVTTANMQKDYVGTLADTSIGIYIVSGVAIDVIVKPQVFDLTAMFGSTIADYIYSLEQATAGSGVAYFRSLFPKDYYAYNAGQLMSVKALSHKMVGFNQFDKSTATLGQYIKNDGTTASDTRVFYSDYIKVIPNTVYFFKHIIGTSSLSVSIFEYDSNKSLIGKYSAGYGGNISVGGKETEYTTSNDAYYIRFDGVKDSIDDTCFNLHWDGERDGEYEAYSEHIYPLDSDLELRGIPKLDSNNKLYYDGDTYESDGTVTRKYALVDLGTLTWAKINDENYPNRFSTSISGIGTNMICVGHIFNGVGGYGSAIAEDKTFVVNNKNLFFHDSAYTDATTFKTAMSGVYLVYELATPTTETADAFENLQIAGYYGTEEFIDAEESAGNRDVAIPVGHNTDYFNSSILAYNIDYTDDKCDELKDYIDTQIQQNITSVLNASY